MKSEEKSVDAAGLYESLCLVVSIAFGGNSVSKEIKPAPKNRKELEAVFNGLF